MGRLASFAIGLVLGVAAVGGLALRFTDPVDAPGHVARECRLIAALESRRMGFEAERARDTPLPYHLHRAEGVAGSPKAFQPRGAALRPIDWILARLGRKAVRPIDCGAALKAAKVPAAVVFSPEPPRTISHSIYSRAVFWPGDRYALVSWTPCDLYVEGWNQKTYPMLLRREAQAWRPVETKDELLQHTVRPYAGPAMPCFRR